MAGRDIAVGARAPCRVASLPIDRRSQSEGLDPGGRNAAPPLRVRTILAVTDTIVVSVSSQTGSVEGLHASAGFWGFQPSKPVPPDAVSVSS